jgi:hypothetical protein
MNFNRLKLPYICFIAIYVFLVNTEVIAQGHLFELEAGKMRMTISANGGRIVSLKFNETEFLTQASEHENFGSTLWTAPQSNWGWPPFAVLDSMEYKVIRQGNILKMTSNPDPKSGFQIEKTWQPSGENSILINYSIRNISDQSKSVGAWEVTRVPCGGLAFFPDGGEGKVPVSKLKPDSRQKGINWLSVNKQPIPHHLKLYSTASEGWIAYAIQGMLFIKQFPDTKPEEYSPQQGEVEIYINKDKSYTELENQGVYQTLNPGEALNYQESWYIAPIPERWETEVGNEKLVGKVRQIIKTGKKF